MDEIEQADAVAFVLAHLREDEDAVNALLGMHGLEKLFPAAVGVLVRVLADTGVDEAALEAMLAGWQEQRRTMFGRWE